MRGRTFVELNKDTLLPFLIYNRPFQYSENITLHPVTMKNIVTFQMLTPSITLRKDGIFHDKKIIKMTYWDFLIYCFGNEELEIKYQINGLSQYFLYAIQLLKLCCIDFDIDEFLNYDTEQRLLKAENDLRKKQDKANIEDYIDSLTIAMNTTEDHIKNMTIRKFWRYIKRYQLHESYTIAKTGECSGMVSFKEPIKHWMISLEEEDKYNHLKTDENKLRGKIG